MWSKRRSKKGSFGSGPHPGKGGRLLPLHAVVYASLVSRIDLKLTPAHKKRLYQGLARLGPRDMHNARIELAPAVEIDVGRLVGNVLERAERYREGSAMRR